MGSVLVTGGCGFIGANLVPKLLQQGYSVTVYDDLSRGRLEYLADPGACRFIRGDIRDELRLCAALKGVDFVVHLAAYGSVVESVVNPDDNFSVNAEGTFTVLNAARKSGIKKLVFSSTGGALIGNATPPVDETSVPRPISPYGASKLAGEGYCCAFAHSYEMSITALRFANVIGPISRHKKGAVTVFLKALMAGEDIRIYGDGGATRDFLYVDDLCNGLIAAMKAEKRGFNVYHLASGREVSILELAELARTVASAPHHPIRFEPKRTGEVERNFASCERARAELGFSPSIGLEQAMRMTWDWFRMQDLD